MAEKYICLAEYNCPCRPPGRQVGKTTVRRHLALANEQRRKFSALGLLQLGPKYSKEASAEQKKKHDALFVDYDLQTDSAFREKLIPGRVRVCDCADGRRLFLRVGDYSPPYAHVSPKSAAGAMGQARRSVRDCRAHCETSECGSTTHRRPAGQQPAEHERALPARLEPASLNLYVCHNATASPSTSSSSVDVGGICEDAPPWIAGLVATPDPPKPTNEGSYSGDEEYGNANPGSNYFMDTNEERGETEKVFNILKEHALTLLNLHSQTVFCRNLQMTTDLVGEQRACFGFETGV